MRISSRPSAWVSCIPRPVSSSKGTRPLSPAGSRVAGSSHALRYGSTIWTVSNSCSSAAISTASSSFVYSSFISNLTCAKSRIDPQSGPVYICILPQFANFSYLSVAQRIFRVPVEYWRCLQIMPCRIPWHGNTGRTKRGSPWPGPGSAPYHRHATASCPGLCPGCSSGPPGRLPASPPAE